MQTHRTPAGIAAALDAAGMLQSPEAARELDGMTRRMMRAEQRRAELEAVLDTHRDDDAAEIKRLRARVAELEQQSADTSPWQRAVDGLNALVDARIGFHIEPDGHISNPSGDEHIEWDRAVERFVLVHDDDPGPTPAESAARPRGVLAPAVPPMARPWRGPRGERP
ncbi:hypothetical protein AB0O20_28675 [Streptomyces kronopolitis]|uniref:ABC transporter C-terminal domain-containing protein n=1 Tax=Streptomyces kronopolitis TaxID=1612435 RepID=UPI003421C5CA